MQPASSSAPRTGDSGVTWRSVCACFTARPGRRKTQWIDERFCATWPWSAHAPPGVLQRDAHERGAHHTPLAAAPRHRPQYAEVAAHRIGTALPGLLTVRFSCRMTLITSRPVISTTLSTHPTRRRLRSARRSATCSVASRSPEAKTCRSRCGQGVTVTPHTPRDLDSSSTSLLCMASQRSRRRVTGNRRPGIRSLPSVPAPS